MQNYNATCDGPTAYPIRDKNECDLATESLSSELYHVLGQLSTIENVKDNPKGCHFNPLDKRVYWNNHLFGESTRYNRRICKYPGDFVIYRLVSITGYLFLKYLLQFEHNAMRFPRTDFVVGCWTSQECPSGYECRDGACKAGKSLMA